MKEAGGHRAPARPPRSSLELPEGPSLQPTEVKVKSLSRVPTLQPHGLNPPRLLPHPWDSPGKSTGTEWVAMTSSRDLPNTGIEPGSPASQADSLPSEPPGKLTEVASNVPYVELLIKLESA